MINVCCSKCGHTQPKANVCAECGCSVLNETDSFKVSKADFLSGHNNFNTDKKYSWIVYTLTAVVLLALIISVLAFNIIPRYNSAKNIKTGSSSGTELPTDNVLKENNLPVEKRELTGYEATMTAKNAALVESPATKIEFKNSDQPAITVEMQPGVKIITDAQGKSVNSYQLKFSSTDPRSEFMVKQPMQIKSENGVIDLESSLENAVIAGSKGVHVHTVYFLSDSQMADVKFLAGDTIELSVGNYKSHINKTEFTKIKSFLTDLGE